MAVAAAARAGSVRRWGFLIDVQFLAVAIHERYERRRDRTTSQGEGEVARPEEELGPSSGRLEDLTLLLEQRDITLPKPELWPEGIDELEAFEYSVTDPGNVKTGAPHGIHDDCMTTA